MQFVLMIYHGPTPTIPGSASWDALPESEQKQVYADYADLNKTDGFKPGPPLGLPNAAKTVQITDRKTQIKGGNYQSESVGGYAVIEAENIEAAIALAQRIPAARLGGAIEIRPVEKYW